MASGKPIVRQVAWVSLVPQLLFFALLGVIYGHFTETITTAVFLAAITYLLFSAALKASLSHNHRKGIALFKAGKYEQAIEEFKKSYVFFSKHVWIDKCRFFTLLSSSRMSYREMALINIAFCYSQINDGRNSKEYYLKAIEQFPRSEMANTALKFIESVENDNT